MIGLYDLQQLEKARDLVNSVYNYNFGCYEDRKIVSRVETISNKLTDVINLIKEPLQKEGRLV